MIKSVSLEFVTAFKKLFVDTKMLGLDRCCCYYVRFLHVDHLWVIWQYSSDLYLEYI